MFEMIMKTRYDNDWKPVENIPHVPTIEEAVYLGSVIANASAHQSFRAYVSLFGPTIPTGKSPEVLTNSPTGLAMEWIVVSPFDGYRVTTVSYREVS